MVHLRVLATPNPVDATPRAGFVVSRAVGGSVVRHRVVRRLRHLLRGRLADLPAGSRLVVRALPPAADAPSSVLAHDLDSALRTALAHVGAVRSMGASTPSTSAHKGAE